MFRLNREKNRLTKFKGRAVLEIKRIMPDFLRYDVFLNKLRFKGKTQVDDIESFYLFTDIYDHFFLARLLHERKRVFVYVYSWDHPCKFLRFSKRANYLVWSEGIREDLYELQGVSPDRVKVVGATQFSYVEEFVRLDKSRLEAPYPFDYLYFGCSVATPKLLEEEVSVIKQVSKQLARFQPAMKLVVRPYPVLSNWKYYEPLRDLPNVVFDDQYRVGDKSMQENTFHEKYTKIYFAKGFFHLGTTLGLEACFTGTPSFIINFRSLRKQAGYVTMYHFVHQYQNEKYLLLEKYPNVVNDQDSLRTIFTELDREKEKYLAYNRAVVNNFRLFSTREVASNFLNAQAGGTGGNQLNIKT